MYVEQLGRMMGLPFIGVRLGVVYGVGPVMKREASFMTVPNLFCQRAVEGKVLEVIDDRPLAFIHVEDAARALLAAGGLLNGGPVWQAVNAAPEVVTIGDVALHVQRQAQAQGRFVRTLGGRVSAPRFSVCSRLDAVGFAPKRSMDEALGETMTYFQATGA
jgi:nucleoside-diphosphate-sugar epimerase